MVNLDVFFSRLIPNVIGCPEPLALQALRDSAIEFCHRSLVVSQTLDPITVLEGFADYEVETPTGTTVAQAQKVWYDNTLILPAPYEAVTSRDAIAGTPRYYYGRDIDEVFHLSLLPTPDKTLRNGLVLRVALRPTRTATQVHNILYERYAEAIVMGAMGILMATPDQSFTDLTMAGAATAKARALANNARFEMMHGRVQSSLSVRMRAF